MAAQRKLRLSYLVKFQWWSLLKKWKGNTWIEIETETHELKINKWLRKWKWYTRKRESESYPVAAQIPLFSKLSVMIFVEKVKVKWKNKVRVTQWQHKGSWGYLADNDEEQEPPQPQEALNKYHRHCHCHCHCHIVNVIVIVIVLMNILILIFIFNTLEYKFTFIILLITMRSKKIFLAMRGCSKFGTIQSNFSF